MNYTLMHKNIPVADVSIYEESGTITAITAAHNTDHLPVGVHFRHGSFIDKRELNGWFRERCIPAMRDSASKLLTGLNLHSLKQLVLYSNGLCLSDSYWFKPADSNKNWEDVNFFGNSFSEDVGDLLLEIISPSDKLDLCSPDNTTEGCLKKRWKIIDGKRCLVKGGEPPYFQQPINEVIATMVMKRLGVPHIPYSLTWINGEPYSVCEDFITPETELVTAWRVMQIHPKANHHSHFLHYTNLCEENGLTDIRRALDEMMVVDYIIANEDRHFNNFGIIRNSDTLEWVSAAPIFDSGTSLDCGKDFYICKPFKVTHGEQLRLVSSYDWLDFSRLEGIDEEINEFLSDEKLAAFIDEDRRKKLVDFVVERIGRLEEIAMNCK